MAMLMMMMMIVLHHWALWVPIWCPSFDEPNPERYHWWYLVRRDWRLYCWAIQVPHRITSWDTSQFQEAVRVTLSIPNFCQPCTDSCIELRCSRHGMSGSKTHLQQHWIVATGSAPLQGFTGEKFHGPANSSCSDKRQRRNAPKEIYLFSGHGL